MANELSGLFLHSEAELKFHTEYVTNMKELRKEKMNSMQVG